MQDTQLKLIWEFRGVDALETARHHELHLKDYFNTKALPQYGIGVKNLSNTYCVAFVIVDQSNLEQLKSELKPHRGFLHTP